MWKKEKKRKEKNREREREREREKERREEAGLVHAERERERERDRGHGVDGDCLWSSSTRWSAWSSTGEGQRAASRGQREGWVVGFSFFVLGYITKSTVMICPSIKICNFLFISFFTTSVSIVSEKKKKKRDITRTPESNKSYQYPCPTHVGHRYFAKNGMSVQPRA